LSGPVSIASLESGVRSREVRSQELNSWLQIAFHRYAGKLRAQVGKESLIV
jgi:hypothetical protein